VADLVNSQQVADYLGVSIKAIEYWRAKRVGPPHIAQSHRRIRYSIGAVDKWMQSISADEIKMWESARQKMNEDDQI